MITLKSLRGTGEDFQGLSGIYGAQPGGATGSNMMDDVTVALREHLGVVHLPVNYYASIAPAGGTKMFHESYADGWDKAVSSDGDQNPSIWVGYSLGALILGDLLAAGALKNCIGAILFADPYRPAGVCHNKGVHPGDYGCAGNRPIIQSDAVEQIPVYQFAAPDDPITTLPRGNGFRLFAEIVTGKAQPFNPGYLNLNDIVSATGRYLGTPKTKWTPSKISRHVVYNRENAPGEDRTYTQIAAGLAVDLVENYRVAHPEA